MTTPEPAATCSDLVAQALAAAPAPRAELLVRAEALADGASDWQRIADAWAANGDVAAAECCLVQVLREPDPTPWGWRGVAATRVALGDLAGALAILDQAVAAELVGGVRDGWRWRRLAEGFHELGEGRGVERCLAIGAERAHTVADLVSIVTALVELRADQGTARTLLERADGLARTFVAGESESAAYRYWQVAGAWRDWLADTARATAMLAFGSQRVVDLRDCLTMAEAWRDHEAAPGANAAAVGQCLRKAEGVARDPDDWLLGAEQWLASAANADEARRAWQQAGGLASTPEAKWKVATTGERWFGAMAADPGVAALGVTPDELAPPGASELGWPQDAAALFDWLRAQVTDPMLATIAAADYGDDVDEHLAALRHMRDHGRLLLPLRGHPLEVLSLRKWSQGLGVDHVERAFCCVVLCLAELGPDPSGFGGIESTLAVLLESCHLLGTEALSRLVGLLVAMAAHQTEAHGCESLFTLLALLLVTAALDAADARLEPLAQRLLVLERRQSDDGYPHPEHGFVLGATHYDLRHDVWQRLVQSTFADWSDDAARPALTQVAQRLLAR